jgi:DNA-binding MarR family transcriptional regulator
MSSAEPGTDVGDDYVGCLAGHTRAAVRAITREYDSALRAHGLRITQVAILAQLRRLQPQTVTAFAQAHGSDRSAVARDLAVLERQGLVASTPNAHDRRARNLFVTPAGERKLAECAPAWRAAQARMRERLGEADAAALLGLANRVASALA